MKRRAIRVDPFQKRLDRPILVRSARDIVFSILRPAIPAGVLAAAVAAAIGSAWGAVAALSLVVAACAAWLSVRRDPSAMLILSRSALREGRLEGWIEAQSESRSWRVAAGAASATVDAQQRGRVVVIPLSAPIDTGGGEVRVRAVPLEGSGAASFIVRVIRERP